MLTKTSASRRRAPDQLTARPAAAGQPEPELAPIVDPSPANGVTEIRVHGVGGATPAAMLQLSDAYQVDPHLVAGDRVAGFYRGPDRSRGRHVEAYSWGGLTSNSRIRALWIFLLPFMLANLAGWTSPPRGERHETPAEPKGPVHELRLAAAKWGALALTLSVMTIATILVMDVVAYQCGAQPACTAGATWLAPLTWGDLPENPAHRLVVGAAVLMAVIGAFAVLSYTSRARYEAIEPPCTVTDRASTPTRASSSAAHLPDGLLARDFWSGRQAHARLTRVHLNGGLAVVTTILVVCAERLDRLAPVAGFSWSTGDTPQVALRVGTLGLVVVSLVTGIGILATDDTPRLRRVPWPSVLSLVLGSVALVAAGVAAWRQEPPSPLPAPGQTPGLTTVVTLVWLTVTVLLLPLFTASLVGRPRRPARDRDGIGWIPPFAVLGVGIIVAKVVLLSLLVFVAQRLSGDAAVVYGSGPLPPSNEAGHPMMLPSMVGIAIAYFVWTILALLAGFVGVFVVSYWRAGRGRSLAAFLASTSGRDYAGETETYTEAFRRRGGVRAWQYTATVPNEPSTDPADDLGGPVPTAWTRRRARWEFLARSSSYVSAFVNTLVIVAVLVVAAVWVDASVARHDPPPIGVDAAVTIALLLPPALAAFIAMSWRNLAQRRILGVLWDVGTFWPRSFHPFAPPCYAERAVPELTRRVWWLNDRGGEVVLAAHSQGSILAAATALRHDLEVDNRPRFGLVTFGSPLRKLYGRAFPAYWPRRAIAAVREERTGLVVGGLWRNVYYLTDYIGGAVHVSPVDIRLPDPQSSVYVYGQPQPPVLSHTRYASDPRFRAVVDEVCDEVESVAERRALAATRRMLLLQAAVRRMFSWTPFV